MAETSKSLVVVVPRPHQRTLTEEQLSTRIRELLGVREERTMDLFSRAARRALQAALGSLAVLPVQGLTHEERVDDAMPLLIQVVQALLADDPTLLDSELAVWGPDVPEVEASIVLGESRFEIGVVYAEHPHRPRHYIRVADFHRYLLDEKRSEFERLAGALGAKEIRVAERTAESKSRGGNVGVDAPMSPATPSVRVGASVESKESSEVVFALECSFAPKVGRPEVPEGLCWLRSEPQWQAMIDARVGNVRATRRKVTFQYVAEYAVSAQLDAKVLQWGLSCGGKLETMRRVDLDYLVEFHEVE